MARRRRTFARRADGTLEVTLSRGELAVLGDLAGELTELLEATAADDAAVERLFPRAYLDPTEEQAESEWQALAGSDLLRGRLDALAALVRSVSSGGDDDRPGARGAELDVAVTVVLDAQGEAAWLGVVNDLRLVLGTRLGVSDEPDAPPLPHDGPLAPLAALYAWLSYLEEELVDLLIGELPEDEAPPS